METGLTTDQMTDLAKTGAVARLATIEAERESLLKFLNGSGPDSNKGVRGKRITKRRKKLHWTQRPENAAKLAAMHKKSAATRKDA